MAGNDSYPDRIAGPTSPGRDRAGAASAGTAPIHAPSKLGFSGAAGRGREYWWNKLDSSVRKAIKDGVGRTVEWWATTLENDPSRPYAVVLGRAGLAIAVPVLGERRRPTHDVQITRFVPSSVRQSTVKQRPQSRVARLWRGPSGGGADAPSGDSGAISGQRMRGFLGNLPAEAQTLLQAPFLTGDRVEGAEYYYEGTTEELDAWCYIAGERFVTFASGHRSLPAHAPLYRAAWRMVCRQAEIKGV